MSIRVRVKNFQSIKDVEVHIDGFAVITGPNNSGKTALMRAIHGAFTNAAPGPLIRHGEAFLSVELEFGDGTILLWEKGWEKPDQKGKVVNRYTINGMVINAVGKGPPPEVEAIGVQQITASTDRVWPQIAEQFDGVLFLVNRPASAIAEALSDVERVGKLSNALKLSEKDRRSVSGELEVRRKDVKQLKADLKSYEGLDQVSSQIKILDQNYKKLKEVGDKLLGVKFLRQKHRDLRDQCAFFTGFPAVAEGISHLNSSLSSLQTTQTDMNLARDLLKKHKILRDVMSSLSGFSVSLPELSRVQKLSEVSKLCGNLRKRRNSALGELKGFEFGQIPVLPDSGEAQSIFTQLQDFRVLVLNLKGARSSLQSLFNSEAQLNQEFAETKDLVQSLLGDRGVCPTCHTIHDGENHDSISVAN